MFRDLRSWGLRPLGSRLRGLGVLGYLVRIWGLGSWNDMNYSLNSLKGGSIGGYIGDYIGDYHRGY